MKEQNEEFKKGYPDKRGLYRCLVDGQVRHLVHHKCDITGRHWWTDTAKIRVAPVASSRYA